MKEIASIMTLVLKKNTADNAPSGGKSKAKFTVEAGAKAEARSRADAVLKRYPVYPELDLGLIESFVEQAVRARA